MNNSNNQHFNKSVIDIKKFHSWKLYSIGFAYDFQDTW